MAKLFVLLLGFLKFGKLGGAALTMLVSLAAYAGLYGWRYAAGFIALIFVHEMGHFLAARQRGLAVSAPTFIPFVGAWVELKDQPTNVETEAYVAAAGPFVGSIAATFIYFWGRDTESRLLLAIAYSGFFLNFFNLIPLSPLDGGRITAILSPRIWLLGAPIMLAMMIYRPSPLLLVIALASLPALVKAWKFDPTAPENQAYYNVPVKLKVECGTFYLGLVAFLAIMADAVHEMLQAPTPE
jgi:Zn-dependent protease